MPGLQELWRLHKSGVVANCGMAIDAQGYAVIVTRDGQTVCVRHHSDSRTATESAMAIQLEYLNDGWSGVFPR